MNRNKGLEALEHINKNIVVSQDDIDEDINIIEKELKALKIIVRKANIRLGKQGEQYYFKTTNNYYWISKEKYDLLKEVLYGN